MGCGRATPIAKKQVPVQGGVQLVHKGHLDRAEQWLSLVLDLWDAKAKLNSRGEYGFTGDQVGDGPRVGLGLGLRRNICVRVRVRFRVGLGLGLRQNIWLGLGLGLRQNIWVMVRVRSTSKHLG